jgi:hypothetical protein
MLSTDNVFSFRGTTIADAEIRERPNGGRYLRLYLAGGGTLAVEADGNDLTVSDETSIP